MFILKTFYNGRKIPIIPPLLEDGKLESDFKIKVNYLTIIFFASLCTTLVNSSELPDKSTYNSAARLASIKFNNSDVLKIIRFLNVSKAHEHDGTSVRMIKVGD